MTGIPERVTRQAESLATKMVNKMMGKKISNASLPKQIELARKLCRAAGTVNFRANLLKDGGLPSDIGDLFKKGMPREEVKAYYWECKEFVDFWAYIGCTEDMLDEIIRAKNT